MTTYDKLYTNIYASLLLCKKFSGFDILSSLYNKNVFSSFNLVEHIDV